MERIALTDDSGCWFDREKAEAFVEHTRWDGRNHVSMATGSQWDFETLYRTASGRWVLKSSSQWQGSLDTYVEVTDQEAAQWFMRNEYSDDQIPDDLLEMLKGDIDDLEV